MRIGPRRRLLHTVCLPSASCGRTWLSSWRNRRNSRCWLRRSPAGVIATSGFRVRCLRSCRPFCGGLPGSILSTLIPSLIHHTASRDSPATAVEANGAPVSLRIACGRPFSRCQVCSPGLYPNSAQTPSTLAAGFRELEPENQMNFGPHPSASGTDAFAYDFSPADSSSGLPNSTICWFVDTALSGMSKYLDG